MPAWGCVHCLQDQQSDTVDGKINIKKLRSMYGILLPVLQRQRIPYDHKPVCRSLVTAVVDVLGNDGEGVGAMTGASLVQSSQWGCLDRPPPPLADVSMCWRATAICSCAVHLPSPEPHHLQPTKRCPETILLPLH